MPPKCRLDLRITPFPTLRFQTNSENEPLSLIRPNNIESQTVEEIILGTRCQNNKLHANSVQVK